MQNKLEWLRIAGAGAAILLVWLGVLSHDTSLIVSVAAVAISGYPVLREAAKALMKRRMTMELSMAIAIIAALVAQESFTAQVIVFFVLIAEALEHATVHRGRHSISSLLDLLPRTATVKRASELFDIPAEQVKAGDTVVVRPGARIVVDGVVLTGNTFVDEATITGESLPVEKLPGMPVFAGTVNQSGAIEVQAERVGADTAFGKIVHAVEESENARATVQKTADKFAGYLVLFSFVAAAVTFLITGSLEQTISAIIVSGACGVAAGTPLAILGAIGRAAQIGSIVKGGLHLETLARVDTVVFDKTGTLTYGKPHVVGIRPAPGVTPQAVLAVAASAENLSEHPLARAILTRSAELGVEAKPACGVSYTPGRGIACEVDGARVLVGNRALMHDQSVNSVPATSPRNVHATEVYIARDGVFVGIISIADTVREEAKQAVAELQAMGIRTVMLTGDAEPVARAVAQKLGIDEVEAELRPEEKRERVRELMHVGRITAMIGDGVNDAPALSEASVGVAVGSATAVAMESADVLLIGSDMLKFVETVRIARRTQRVIWFNFVGTVVVDAVGIGLAFAGMLNPILAALVHVGSEVAFLLNSARLLKIRR